MKDRLRCGSNIRSNGLVLSLNYCSQSFVTEAVEAGTGLGRAGSHSDRAGVERLEEGTSPHHREGYPSLLPRTGKEGHSAQLHGFSNASDVAYAGVVYLRVFYADTTTSVSVVLSKTRIAPLSTMMTPRLELCGAQLLSKLLGTVAKSFSIPIESIYAWCDSTNTLCWLSTPPSRLESFVCNRVVDTTSRVPASQWRYVLTDCNPADLASTGNNPSQLMTFH